MLTVKTNQRGNKQIQYQNHLYNRKNIMRDGRIKWICNVRECNAKIVTSSNFEIDKLVLEENDLHIHEEEIDDEKVKLINKMTEQIKTSELPIRGIVHNNIRGLDEDIILRLGDFETIYRRLRRVRENSINPNPIDLTKLIFQKD